VLIHILNSVIGDDSSLPAPAIKFSSPSDLGPGCLLANVWVEGCLASPLLNRGYMCNLLHAICCRGAK